MNEPQKRIDDFFDEQLTDDETKELLEWVKATPENAKFFAKQSYFHRQLRDTIVGQDAVAFENQRQVGQTCKINDFPSPCSVELGSSQQARRLNRSIPWTLAISLSLLIALGNWLMIPNLSDGRIAQVRQTIDFGSDHAGLIKVGNWLKQERIQIQKGVVRLDFTNGVSVTLEGPADFEIFSPSRTCLYSGLLTAVVPEQAIGFKVETAALDIVDLGTAFGISVDGNGVTDVAVFEGEVKVNLPDDRQSPEVFLVEGEAVRASVETREISNVEFENEAYARSWPINSGVLKTVGAFKFVGPGPPWNLGAYENDEYVMVFPEHSGIVVTRKIPVEIAEPGDYINIADFSDHIQPKKRRVRSYLLQFNPLGRFPEPDAHTLIGEITFEREVIGVILAGESLRATDEIFGAESSRYGGGSRGVEIIKPNTNPEQIPLLDSISLSEDRKTIRLKLRAGINVDQIRVLVDARRGARFRDQPKSAK